MEQHSSENLVPTSSAFQFGSLAYNPGIEIKNEHPLGGSGTRL